MSVEEIIGWIPIFIAFITAYPISMLEYGHRKFRKNYLLLFVISLPFHLYGFLHGLLAVLIYWVLSEKHLLATGEVAFVLNPLLVGLGIKGITNLNFYNIVSAKGKEEKMEITPLGPKLIMDSIEKYSETLIEDNHDKYLDMQIHQSLKNPLQQIPTATLLKEMPKFLPHSLERVVQVAFMDEVKESIATHKGDLHFAMRLFVSQYGLSRYKMFVKGFRK